MHAKRNKSGGRTGKGRGVPVRLAQFIARRYGLAQIIVWTFDKQDRQRILYWAADDGHAAVAGDFSTRIATALGWPRRPDDFETSKVRRFKARITELEVACAQIIEREGDPIAIARGVLRAPDES